MILYRISLLIFIFSLPLLAKSKEKIFFDERGNVITKEAALSQMPKTEKETIPPKRAQKTTATTPLNADRLNPIAENNNADNDEEAALALQKQALTKVYLENAQLYLRSNRLDKALEFLKKSEEAGQDAFSRESRLLSLFVRARRGDTNLENEADSQDEASKAETLLRIADGYDACAREQIKKQYCRDDAERLYALIGEWTPRSNEGRLARLRLGLTLVDAGRYEAALPILTQMLTDEQNSIKSGQAEIPYDRAWYNLGQLYERPWYHQDAHKARLAYKQVLKYRESPYRQAAADRLKHLERFYTGY